MSDLLGLRVSVPNASGHGYIRYIGPIRNKSGLFVGLELQGSLASSRGKNSGSVDGVQYFTVGVPKSGLFLPYDRLRSVNMQLLPDVKLIQNGQRETNGSLNFTTPIRPTPSSRFSPMAQPPYHSVHRSSAKIYHSGNDQIISEQQQQQQHDYDLEHRRTSSWSLDQHRSEVSTTPLRSPLTPSNTYRETKLNLLDEQLYKLENGHDYREQIEELNKLIREKDRKLENFNKQRLEWHNAMDDLIAVQQDGITVFEEKIQELEDINKNQSVEIEALKKKLKSSDQKLKELEKECAELRSQTKATGSIKEANVKIESLEKTCSNYSSEIEQLRKQLSDANGKIKALEEQGMDKMHQTTSDQNLAPPIKLERLISLSTVSSNFAPSGTNDTTKAMRSVTDDGSSDSIQDLPVYKPSHLTDPSAGRSDWCGLCERDGHSSINCPFENDIF